MLTSRVHMPPPSPKVVALSRRITSSTSVNGIAEITGPKISSCAMRISRRTPFAVDQHPLELAVGIGVPGGRNGFWHCAMVQLLLLGVCGGGGGYSATATALTSV